MLHPVLGAPSRPHQNGGSPARLVDRCARAVRCSSGSVVFARGPITCCAGGLRGPTLPVGSALGETWPASRYRRSSTHEQLPRDEDSKPGLVVQHGRGIGPSWAASRCASTARATRGPRPPPLSRPSAAVHHDQAVIARRVSGATLTVPDRAVRPSPLTDRRQERRERAPPRPSAPPTGSRQSTAQREDERQPICGLAGAGPLHH
jgi:hypothetical protein